MSTRADRQLRHVRRSEQEVRATMREAFEHALKRSRASRSAVANWLNRDVSTLRRWLNDEEAEIDFYAVARTSLWPHFLRCLVVLERKARRV